MTRILLLLCIAVLSGCQHGEPSSSEQTNPQPVPQPTPQPSSISEKRAKLEQIRESLAEVARKVETYERCMREAQARCDELL